MKYEKQYFINSVNLNADTDFPYLVLNVINDYVYPRNPGFKEMHWHEDIQFIYMIRGNMKIHTLNTKVNLREGEGIFINKNVVHLITENNNCNYKSFIFLDKFLKFYFGSPAQKMVESITESQVIEYIHFKDDIKWQGQVLDILKKLSCLEEEKSKFYEYEVLSLFCQLWLIVLKNVEIKEGNKKNILSERMQNFLQYIEENYTENISLEELSKSANVSKSECLRCFKKSLHTTPYKYIMEYRLSKAANMLRYSDKPIGNIAIDVGFNQMSHFGKCFKEKTGYSPKQYRNLYK